jgi:spore germination protein GerM
MQDQYNVRCIPVLCVIAGLSAVLLSVGGCSPEENSNSSESSTTTTPSPIASVPSQPAQPSTSIQRKPAQPLASTPNKPVQSVRGETVKVYWVNSVNNKVEVVPSSVTLKSTDKPGELLESAFNSLLAGPTDPAFATTIPQGTKLRKVTPKSDGVHVDLSKEFTDGGGSTSMTGRVAQVIYTASTLEPSAKVWISVEGKPLEVLGGEGLMLDQPITRETFEQNFNL